MRMQIKTIGKNQIEVIYKGSRILLSYDTPVAACIDGKYFRTSKLWSSTTSKHITEWLNDEHYVLLEQSFFDSLLDE